MQKNSRDFDWQDRVISAARRLLDECERVLDEEAADIAWHQVDALLERGSALLGGDLDELRRVEGGVRARG